MNRPWFTWTLFAACLAVVVAAMGWTSLTVLRLDAAEASARRQAALEENVRLALWRMDSALAPLLAQESARPYFVYRTYLPADRAYAPVFRRNTEPAAMLPSPLLKDTSPLVRVHFQYEPDGRLTSPQVPSGPLPTPLSQYLSPETIAKAKGALQRLSTITDRGRLAMALPKTDFAPLEVVYASRADQAGPGIESLREPQARRSRGAIEFDQRSQAVTQNVANMVQSQLANTAPGQVLDATEVGGAAMTPLWIGDELILARQVVIGGQPYLQGCLLDWPAVERWLLAMVEDLLPEAKLQRDDASHSASPSHRLAAIPARLVPGRAISGAPISSPIRWTLGAAWAAVLLAAAAGGALVAGVLRLSARRAAFVSAVTHELRTPLTTFHMYTEMLAEGMVPDPSLQQQYLRTLKAEASRLSHLVENVLAYARLERRRPAGRIEEEAVGRLLEPMRPRLAERAAQAGLELVVEAGDEDLAALVRANPSALEQILLNLVDNACKYASSAEDRRLHLAIRRVGSRVELRVRDHGPGIAGGARRRFRPFAKSAQEAANSAPGVGLGLALSRRLARDMGGELRCDPTVADGACFVLALAGG